MLPAPTADLARAEADLRQHGVCMVADALDAPTLTRTHDALYRAAADDLDRGRVVKFGLDHAHDDTNQRVWALPSRDAVFCDLVERPAALALVTAMIGWPALLSNIAANITGPGGGEMVLHADQLSMPQPWSGGQGVNVAWCLDDFTEATGATRIVPGSHALKPDAHARGGERRRQRPARRAWVSSTASHRADAPPPRPLRPLSRANIDFCVL